MGIFGWSYPPGCSGPPEHDGPCDVCGQNVDLCVCPECPECGSYGDPDCYTEGHLVLTQEQKDAKAHADEAYAEQCRQERECEDAAAKEYAEYLKDLAMRGADVTILGDLH